MLSKYKIIAELFNKIIYLERYLKRILKWKIIKNENLTYIFMFLFLCVTSVHQLLSTIV